MGAVPENEMNYITKIVSVVLIISFTAAVNGECLRPASTISTAPLGLDWATLAAGKTLELAGYIRQLRMPERIEAIKSLISQKRDSDEIIAVLNIVLIGRSYETKELFAELGYYERLEFISKCLSLALIRPDSKKIYEYLKGAAATERYILPEAKKLIFSYLAVYEVGKPIKVATVFAVYKEQNNILPLSADNPTGQDLFRKKITQLENLYSINPNLSWQLILVQDGDDIKWWRSDPKSIDIARRIAEEEHPELVESGQITFLELSQEKRERLGSVKGGAIIKGMRWALDNGADYIISTDADLSAPLDGEGWLLEDAIFGKKDLVIGSIYRPDSLGPKRTFIRWLRSKVFIWLVKLILPEIRHISDYQRAFKCYSKQALEAILPLDKEGDFYRRFVYDRTFETNFLAVAKKFKFSMSEAGIIWVDFPAGTTIVPQEILSMLWGLIKQRIFLWLSGEYYEKRIEEHRFRKYLLSKSSISEDTTSKRSAKGIEEATIKTPAAEALTGKGYNLSIFIGQAA